MSLVLLGLLAACSSQAPTPPPAHAPPTDVVHLPAEPPQSSTAEAPTCEVFAEHLRQVFRKDIGEQGDPSGRIGPEAMLARIDDMANGVLMRCKTDNRTAELAEVTSCIVAARSVPEIQSCRGRYPEQGEALHEWMRFEKPPE